MKVLTVVGTRPQFVKAAAVSRAIAGLAPPAIDEVMVHTGQHYDDELSGAFFAELGMALPAHNLGVGSASHAQQTAAMLERLEPVVLAEAPDIVLLYGDTNSTLAGALVAAKLGLRLAHVEAGLRSGRRDMPEEINRVVTDHVATDLFCPSAAAVENLAREGIRAGVALVGDVMLDMLRWTLSQADVQPPAPREYALATVHRAENTDDPERLRAIVGALEHLVADGLAVVLPLHPRTRKALDGWQPPNGLRVTPALTHSALIGLAAGARVILTDSGGLQKEAYWLGVPCVTLRDETEWVETVATGWNVLAGCDDARIVAAATAARPSSPRPPLYGDGRAAEEVVRRLVAGG